MLGKSCKSTWMTNLDKLNVSNVVRINKPILLLDQKRKCFTTFKFRNSHFLCFNIPKAIDKSIFYTDIHIKKGK